MSDNSMQLKNVTIFRPSPLQQNISVYGYSVRITMYYCDFALDLMV